MTDDHGVEQSGRNPPDHAEGSTSKRDDEPATSPGTDGGGDRGPDPESSGSYVCEICGSLMMERHCKILCPVCGYQRDCSDP